MIDEINYSKRLYMKEITNTELEIMSLTGVIKCVTAAKRNNHYELIVESKDAAFAVKTKRGVIRCFKTLNAVESMLHAAGILTFTVLNQA